MTTKFTPGPWRWHRYYLMQDVAGIDNPFSTPCGHPIADDGSAGGEYAETIDTRGPDAHLIAAAPDLYEACDEAYNTLQCVMSLAPGYDWNADPSALTLKTGKAFQQLKAAMDKARGAKAEGR